MGLKEVIGEERNVEYLVVYDKENFTKMDIVYIEGITYKDEDKVYYTLTQMQQTIENEGSVEE